MFSKLASLLNPRREHRSAFGCNTLPPNLMSCIGVLRRRANRNHSDYHDDREMVSVYAQTHERLPLFQCASDGLAQKRFLSRAEGARIACLDMPPLEQNPQPNTRASQILVVQHTGATVGPHGLCVGPGLSERPRPPQPSQHRVCNQACACAQNQEYALTRRASAQPARIQAVKRAIASS